MKITKNIFVSIVSVVVLMFSQVSFAGTAELLKKIQGPGFEVFNKASNPITITIFMDGAFLRYADIGSNQKFLLNIDVNKPMQLGIYNQKTKISTGTFSRDITPAPQYLYTLNAPGKTKYLTWNPAKSPSLYPQTGPLMGLLGKSDSGYPLSSNLTQGQIRTATANR